MEDKFEEDLNEDYDEDLDDEYLYNEDLYDLYAEDDPQDPEESMEDVLLRCDLMNVAETDSRIDFLMHHTISEWEFASVKTTFKQFVIEMIKIIAEANMARVAALEQKEQ